MQVTKMVAALGACLLVMGAAMPLARAQPADAATLKTRVQVSERVPATALTVVMLAELRGSDPVAAQAQVAKQVKAALAQVPQGVNASTAGYRAQRRHRRKGQSKSQWQVSERIALRGASAGELLGLAGRMGRSGLVVEALSYRVPPKVERKHERAMLRRAVHRWRHKIEAMAQAAGECRVIVKTLDTNRSRPAPPRPRLMAAAAHGSNSPHAPPGSERLTATVHGSARARPCSKTGENE